MYSIFLSLIYCIDDFCDIMTSNTITSPIQVAYDSIERVVNDIWYLYSRYTKKLEIHPASDRLFFQRYFAENAKRIKEYITDITFAKLNSKHVVNYQSKKECLLYPKYVNLLIDNTQKFYTEIVEKNGFKKDFKLFHYYDIFKDELLSSFIDNLKDYLRNIYEPPNLAPGKPYRIVQYTANKIMKSSYSTITETKCTPDSVDSLISYMLDGNYSIFIYVYVLSGIFCILLIGALIKYAFVYFNDKKKTALDNESPRESMI